MDSTRGHLGPGRSVALLMVVALGACGQPADTNSSGAEQVSETASTSTGSTSTTTSTSPSSSSSKGGGGKKEEEPETLAWVPFGPADPDVPTPTWPLYTALANGKCSELRKAVPDNDAGDFGLAMAALCAAAVERKHDQWVVLKQLRDADPSRLGNDCVSPIVSGLIERALEWHERYPGLSPKIRFQRLPKTTKCGQQAINSQGGSGEETGGSTSGTTSGSTTGTTTGAPSGDQSSPDTAP
jgi:hypothetical protein